jgi:hypothetical protein
VRRDRVAIDALALLAEPFDESGGIGELAVDFFGPALPPKPGRRRRKSHSSSRLDGWTFNAICGKLLTIAFRLDRVERVMAEYRNFTVRAELASSNELRVRVAAAVFPGSC